MRFDSIEFGTRVRNLRENANYTKKQLADLLHISTEHIKSIESGRRKCSLNLIIELASLFEVSLDYLILGKDSRYEIVKTGIQEVMTLLEQINHEL